MQYTTLDTLYHLVFKAPGSCFQKEEKILLRVRLFFQLHNFMVWRNDLGNMQNREFCVATLYTLYLTFSFFQGSRLKFYNELVA